MVIEGKALKDFLVDDNEKDRTDQFTQQAFDYVSDRVQKADTRGLQEYLRIDKGVMVSWLLPFPGDFHLLMNYQKVMIKIYWDAGLKQIAEASGFRDETLGSLENCSNFTNTSKFFLQVWEALFRHMCKQWQQSIPQPSDIIPSVVQLENFTAFVAKKADGNWKFWGDCNKYLLAIHICAIF